MLNSDANRKEQLEHLAQVHAMSRAIALAISAIEKNDLKQFEAHLAAQENICNRLSNMKSTRASIATGQAASSQSLDARLLQEIRQGHVALAQLNRVYAALLKRVRRSAGLIVALYRSHGEGYDHSPSRLPQHHTWSCEV